MIISFDKSELTDLEKSLNREWVELNDRGNYASSTVLGLHTRKKHGLFLISTASTVQPLLILSHVQEEVFLNRQAFPLYNVEYGNHLILEGLKFLEKFELDPFPSFRYVCNDIKIEKSLCLLHDRAQLIICYHFSGNIPPDSRLVVRPFFAYRSVDAQVNPEIFENTEVFILGKQFRFLPNPELPEVFMQYSDGQFINNPMWYHNFVYRYHPDSDKNPEDLLNPGFFEFALHKNSRIYLSISLEESDPVQLKNSMEREKERRSIFLKANDRRNEKVNYLLGKIHHFQHIERGKNRFFSSHLFDQELYLSLHLMMITRLLQSGVEKNEIITYYEALLNLLKSYNLEELFQGMIKEVKIDPATPFLVIRFLYLYHHYHEKGEAVLTAIQMMLEILELIRKDKILFYKVKSHKLLERQYRKSDLEPRSDYEIFYPLRQNFVLNVLWYNSLQMVLQLADLKKVRVKRYRRWVKKIKHYFYQQYVQGVVAKPYQAIEEYGYAFHPSMIFAITYPFPLLDEKPAQIFYRLLIKQFLSENGITFSLRSKGRLENVSSPILIGDYLDGWEKIMKEKDFLWQYFQNISKRFENDLRTGVLGYISNCPVVEGSPSSIQNDKPSGIACSEVLYFFHRLREISKK